MKLLSRNADYAVRILVALASGDAPLSCRELSYHTDVPYRFLRRIVGSLRKEGFVSTTRGRTGGVSLNAPAHSITLRDVLRIFPSSLLEDGCKTGKRPCRFTGECPARKVLKEMEKDILRRLDAISIQLLARESKGRWVTRRSVSARRR